MKRILFMSLMLAIAGFVVVFGGAVLLPRIAAGLRPQLLQYLAHRLTREERNAIYQQLAQGAAFWEPVPDADVGALAQRSRTMIHAGTDVRINNAGLRASRPYSAKPDGVFRIICLGDSFVFGMGGPEQDRFCDQLEAFYRDQQVSVGGRRIETLAVGLPAWTLVQQATYLVTSITSYDPDLIVVLSVANDISDNLGVSGAGVLTYSFSTESRSLGSSVFFDDINALFGDQGVRAALAWDLSPTSGSRWDKAMQRLQRLIEVQQRRGRHILVSAMAWGATSEPDAFPLLFQTHYQRLETSAPFVMTSFLPGPRTILAHDAHPNRAGHRLLRNQYVHALHRLGWVVVPDSALPELDPRTPLRVNPALDSSRLESLRRRYSSEFPTTIDFSTLRRGHSRAFLGGLFPEGSDPAQALAAPPWASTRAAFLLRRPQGRPLQGVEVEIEIPPRPELFPFWLELLLDGAAAGRVVYQAPNVSGRYRLSGAPAVPAYADQVVEVTLQTGSYFSTIDDPRMKSYRILRARTF